MSDIQDDHVALSTLSETLHKLTDRKNMLGHEERTSIRDELVRLNGKFNDVAYPAIETLAAALPLLYDYSAKWVTARMLRDLAIVQNAQKTLFEENKAELAFNALVAAMMSEKDAGTRYTFANHIADIALKYKDYAVPAAACMLIALADEKDGYGSASIRTALLKVGMEYEAAAALAVHGFSQLLQKETEPAKITHLSKSIREMGLTYASQAPGAIDALVERIDLGEKDPVAVRMLVNDIVYLSAADRDKVPDIIKSLATAFAKADRHETQVSFSQGLTHIGHTHPMAAISAIEELLTRKLPESHSRLLLIGLGDIVQHSGEKTSLCADICADVMLKHLPNETATYSRRIIAKNLLEFVRLGIAVKPVAEALNKSVETEDNIDTRKEMLSVLRAIGHEKAFTASSPTPKVVPFKPYQRYS